MLYGMAKLNEQVVFKAPREQVEDLAREAKRDRRTLSAVNRAIWQRGYRAWKKDGKIFDPLEVVKLDPKVSAVSDDGKKERQRVQKTGTQ